MLYFGIIEQAIVFWIPSCESIIRIGDYSASKNKVPASYVKKKPREPELGVLFLWGVQHKWAPTIVINGVMVPPRNGRKLMGFTIGLFHPYKWNYTVILLIAWDLLKMLGKSPKHIVPNGGLMVICYDPGTKHHLKQTKVTGDWAHLAKKIKSHH